MVILDDQNGDATDTDYDAIGWRLTLTGGTQVDTFPYTDRGDIASAKRGTSASSDSTSSVTRADNGLMRLTERSCPPGSAAEVGLT